ncbi:hypothetical protein PDE_09993 [Penicillium oxalicum 114-2]|uniref:Uncharacterized protein n=1 Tax=Penicillium oxalicum (strain 114-2 / CGMCC 5302) TaxID=933388 RepID=S8B7Q2_PENO1|nr:hypothetical protein PDE_09993 [Penicillium oxalicum 114-2]
MRTSNRPLRSSYGVCGRTPGNSRAWMRETIEAVLIESSFGTCSANRHQVAHARHMAGPRAHLPGLIVCMDSLTEIACASVSGLRDDLSSLDDRAPQMDLSAASGGAGSSCKSGGMEGHADTPDFDEPMERLRLTTGKVPQNFGFKIHLRFFDSSVARPDRLILEASWNKGYEQGLRR